MTGDELERAIDFILKSQARAEARIERNEEQLSRNEEQLSRNQEQFGHLIEQVSQMAQHGAGLRRHLDAVGDSHADLVRAMTRHLETQERINRSLRAADVRQARFSASLAEALRAWVESSRASDESLRAAVTELAVRQGRTEDTVERLSLTVEALVKVVEGGRGGGL